MLYFVRHGQSQANADGVFAGPRLIAPLTKRGEQEAGAEAQRLLSAHLHFDNIIASPVDRARRTARIMAEVLGFDLQKIQIDPRLAEYDMGALSGQPMAGVTPAQKVNAPGAEDPEAFLARVQAALRDAQGLPGNTLLVSHAGVGRMIEAIKQGLAPARFYEIEGYPNARVVKLEV